MRTILYINALSCLLSLALSIFCFVQIVALKYPTEYALVTLEKRIVDRAQLSDEKAKEFDGALATLRWNDRTLKHGYGNLWSVSWPAFFALALVNLATAVSLFTTLQNQRSSRGASDER